MNSVMIDNWMLQDVVNNVYNYNEDISEAYAKFLMAIVLWDDVCYPRNEMSKVWDRINDNIVRRSVRPIADEKHFFDVEATKLFNTYGRNENSVVAQGALRYMLLSNYNDCDYLPVGKRQEFLAQYNPYEINELLNRIDFVCSVDYYINEHYNEIVNIMKKVDFKIKRPVLVDFIMQNTPKDMSYIDFALHLREEGPVVKYRNYLSNLENAIEKGEYLELIAMLKYSNDVVKKITDMDDKSLFSADLSIYPQLSISIARDIKIPKRHIHLSFIEGLGKYAFNGRKLF